MLRLTTHRHFPLQPQPVKVAIDSVFGFKLTACGVDILDPQQKAPTCQPRGAPGEKRCIGMANMKPTGWARRESCDNLHGEPIVKGQADRRQSLVSHHRNNFVQVSLFALRFFCGAERLTFVARWVMIGLRARYNRGLRR